jgi:FlaA1/EpsC-like NDP-sugar epimerase
MNPVPSNQTTIIGDGVFMEHAPAQHARRHGPVLAWRLMAIDFFAWTIAVPFAVLLRFDFTLTNSLTETGLLVGLVAGAAYVACGFAFRIYSGRYISGTFDEAVGIGALSAAVTLAGTLVLFLLPGTLPRATFVIAGISASAVMLVVRLLQRRFRTLRALSRQGERILIYGAGDAGSQVAALMQADASTRFVPVGFIDDDPSKRHLRRSGIRVLGDFNRLPDLVVEHGVATLVIAIAGIRSERLQEIDQLCSSLNVRVQVIPTASEIVGGAVRLGDLSDLSEEEIMGRQSVTTDEKGIDDFLRGRTVLITGAGGSIGSELARQVHRYRPGKLILLDRDESGLHETQLSIDSSGLLTSEDLVLCDIRDRTRLERIMRESQPDIVFHAAALKHLPFLERYPSEAWKTNVIGTSNVLHAAHAANVPYFINISTDKAADPANVLGRSKRITERLVASHRPEKGSWVSVRFGNVLGSRGSVITTFRHQISTGGPVTVTDPDVMRYFMTVREAVHLVLQASIVGHNGEVLVLDMGEPKRIVDVARFMIQRSKREIPITFTGLRPGEKLVEVRGGDNENLSSPVHPLISHAAVAEIHLMPSDDDFSDDEIRQLLHDLTNESVEAAGPIAR